ncbi:MAG: ABC transporter permease [Chloroflexi bacterium]|nr:ABC transporter permease [Chloroflexota bacterium]
MDHWAGVVEAWLRIHTALVYTFLYLPVIVVVLFSFNANRLATIWTGFSLDWYAKALGDQVVIGALQNSFSVALPTAILSTAFGTMAALGLQRVGKRMRIGFDALTYTSIIVPEIVIALSTLILFASTFGIINDATNLRLQMGIPTIIAAHMLFNISIVLLLVRARLSGMDRTHVEASFDLYATPWRTFRQITFPQLLPAIVAGFLLSFTFSFDDYVITSFVSGPGSSTLPIFVFGQVKRGVSPETNAVATMMLAVTLAMLVIGQLVLSWSSRRSGGGQTGGMAGMIAERA